MRLATFLALPGHSATDLARKCQVSVSTITRVARGEKDPSLRLMTAIRKHTQGMVGGDDFLPPLVEAEPTQSNAPAGA